jgi:restriction endonuclease S subunit
MIEKRHEETYRFNYIKLKYVSNINMGQSPDSKDVHLLSEANEQLPFLQGNAEFGKKYPKAKYTCENPKKIANKDDILISVRAPVGALNIADKEYGIGRGLCAITPIKIELDYAWWVLNKNVSKLQKISTGSTYEAVSTEDIKNLSIEYPDTKTQQKIADYLDKETARIDGLIESKEQMLKLLEEKRRAIINRAVTRGLNPEAPTKPSGLDWLGEIPEHWEIKRLKFLTNYPLAYGANEAALDDNPEYPRFVRITDINEDGTLRPETFKSLEPSTAKKYLLKSGDILFARSGATVGKTFIYNESWGESCFAGYLIRFRTDTNKAFPKYIYYYTLSSMYWNQISIDTIQATIQNFSAEKYGNLLICIPPLNEQKQIVAYIEQFTHKHKTLTQELEKSIALLKERRSALIAAAVTGEIDVEGSG